MVKFGLPATLVADPRPSSKSGLQPSHLLGSRNNPHRYKWKINKTYVWLVKEHYEKSTSKVECEFSKQLMTINLYSVFHPVPYSVPYSVFHSVFHSVSHSVPDLMFLQCLIQCFFGASFSATFSAPASFSIWAPREKFLQWPLKRSSR